MFTDARIRMGRKMTIAVLGSFLEDDRFSRQVLIDSKMRSRFLKCSRVEHPKIENDMDI